MTAPSPSSAVVLVHTPIISHVAQDELQCWASTLGSTLRGLRQHPTSSDLESLVLTAATYSFDYDFEILSVKVPEDAN
jgi:hypothetical protein